MEFDVGNKYAGFVPTHCELLSVPRACGLEMSCALQVGMDRQGTTQAWAVTRHDP
jgi:hypothetical protein